MIAGIRLATQPRFMLDVHCLSENFQGFCLCIYSHGCDFSLTSSWLTFGYLPGHGWWRTVRPDDAKVSRPRAKAD